MTDSRNKRYAQPSMILNAGPTSSGGNAFLSIIDRTYDSERGLNFSETTVTEFSLRYNEDNNEVMLIKGDEILYSELLDNA